MLLDAQPGFGDAWFIPVRELTAVLILAGVLLCWRAASPGDRLG
jgi:hypothetical protein